MAKNYNLSGVSGELEFSKGGAKLEGSAGTFSAFANDGVTLTTVEGAPAVLADDFVTLAQLQGHQGFRTVAFTFGSASPLNIGAALPVGAVVTSAFVSVSTPYDMAGATASLGWVASDSAIQAAAAIDLPNAGVYESGSQYTTPGAGNEQLVLTQAPGGATAGAGNVVVYYIIP